MVKGTYPSWTTGVPSRGRFSEKGRHRAGPSLRRGHMGSGSESENPVTKALMGFRNDPFALAAAPRGRQRLGARF